MKRRRRCERKQITGLMLLKKYQAGICRVFLEAFFFVFVFFVENLFTSHQQSINQME